MLHIIQNPRSDYLCLVYSALANTKLFTTTAYITDKKTKWTMMAYRFSNTPKIVIETNVAYLKFSWNKYPTNPLTFLKLVANTKIKQLPKV
jgi:hypothetical protein